MKRMAIEELSGRIEMLIKIAPKERILLTRNGEPFAFVSDATQYDWEDIGYITDPAFWKMIANRRKEKGGISLESVKTELMQREKAEKRSRPVKKTRSKRDRSAA